MSTHTTTVTKNVMHRLLNAAHDWHDTLNSYAGKSDGAIEDAFGRPAEDVRRELRYLNQAIAKAQKAQIGN